MKAVRALASLLALALASPADAGGVAGGSTGLARPTTNFLIITIDDIGREWLHDYNPEGSDGGGPIAGAPDDLPTLSSLADEGVRLEWMTAAATCGPTRAALWSGRYWTRTGQMEPNGLAYDATKEVSIPALLEASWPGLYRRAHFGEYGLAGDGSEKVPGRMGFEYSWHIPGSFVSDYASWPYYETTATSTDDDDITIVASGTGTTSPDAAFVAALSAWLTADGVLPSSRPWLINVGFVLPHAPIHDPDTGIECSTGQAACFVEMRQAMDDHIASVLALFPADVLARTLVIVMSDNGTDLGTTGTSLPDFTYCGGKGTRCEDGSGVIAILAGGVVANGGRVDTVKRSVVDVAATVLDYAHAHARPTTVPDVPGDDRYNGQSYVADGISMRAAISQDCPTGAPCDATHEFVWYASGGASPWPVSGAYAGIDQGGWKFFRYEPTAEEYLYQLTESVFAESVTPDECDGAGDCSGLTGTPLARADAIRAAYSALISASP